jgi:hypothetical protein
MQLTSVKMGLYTSLKWARVSLTHLQQRLGMLGGQLLLIDASQNGFCPSKRSLHILGASSCTADWDDACTHSDFKSEDKQPASCTFDSTAKVCRSRSQQHLRAITCTTYSTEGVPPQETQMKITGREGPQRPHNCSMVTNVQDHICDFCPAPSCRPPVCPQLGPLPRLQCGQMLLSACACSRTPLQRS